MHLLMIIYQFAKVPGEQSHFWQRVASSVWELRLWRFTPSRLYLRTVHFANVLTGYINTWQLPGKLPYKQVTLKLQLYNDCIFV